MKRGLVFLVIIFLLIDFAQAQFNQPRMDSVIPNSAPYRGWFRVFNEYKQFKRRKDRISRRLSQKGKLLYLLN